jgi:hypothetical protein
MNRDHDAFRATIFGKNVVAAFDAHALPPGVLNRTGKRFPCDLFQTASSKICSSLPGEVSCSPASSHNSTASRRFACNSSRVSAWVTQPGSAGTSAQYPPSSALWTIALMIICEIYLHGHENPVPFPASAWRQEEEGSEYFTFSIFHFFRRSHTRCCAGCGSL